MRQVNLSTCLGVQDLHLLVIPSREGLRRNRTIHITMRNVFSRQMMKKVNTIRRNFQKLGFGVFVQGFVFTTDVTRERIGKTSVKTRIFDFSCAVLGEIGGDVERWIVRVEH
jgi:hypothetical protein